MQRVLAVSIPLLLATGCAPAATGGNAGVDVNAAASQAPSAVEAYAVNADAGAAGPSRGNAVTAGRNLPVPLDPPAPGTPGGLPDDRTPIFEAPFTPDSAQGAANVVQTYYALIGEGKYREAFALRTPGAETAQAFTAGFGGYAEYHANVGAPGAIDAGAGQRYVTVPVQIYARLKQGRTPVYQLGSVVLHRTGEIDGATAAQRSWRIERIDLKTVAKR